MPYFLRLFLLLICLQYSLFGQGQELNFQYLTVKDGLPQSTVRTIVKDKYGFMWFGTWNGLARYDGYHFKVYRTIPKDSTSIDNNRIHYIYKDKDGILWISTFNSQICRYNYEADNFTRFDEKELPQYIKDSTNRLKNLDAIHSLSSFLNEKIGTYSLSSTTEHIVFSDYVGNGSGLYDGNVNCVYKDQNGILWLGTTTSGIGIADLNAKKFKHINISDIGPFSGNVPARSLLAERSKIWIGTNDKGLLLFDRAKNKLTKAPLQLSDKSITALYKDAEGNIWIGGRTSLTVFDPKSGTSKKFTNTIGQSKELSRFYSIIEDPVNRELWLCAFDGIYKFFPKEQHFIKQNLDAFFRIPGSGCFYFDSKNNLWLGSEYGGLLFFSRDKTKGALKAPIPIKADGPNALLPDKRIYSIAEDIEGKIWVGTANGLCKIAADLNSSERFSMANGLSDQYITKVIADKEGYIWVAHKKGISKITARTGAVRNYAVSNGQDDYEFTDASGATLAETGELFFGGIDGVVYFNPREIMDSPIKPNVLLTELQVLNRTVTVAEKINGTVILPEALYLTKKIQMPHDLRSFTLNFSALQYANPDKNRYAYQLEGFDKDWVYTDASARTATYANLHPGEYIFKVKASNSDGVWNETPTTLKIIILPPWWLTAWAYGLYTAMVIAALLFIYRIIRARQQYNHQILIERLKAEKAEELETMRSKFFTNVSHEFRTPLTLIVDPLEKLIHNSVPPNKVRAYYEVMLRNSTRLLGLINQLLDFRKLEEDHVKLHVVNDDIALHIKNIVDAFKFQAEQQDIKLSYSSDVERLIIAFDRDVIEKIVYNLLSNALKFTPPKGTVAVELNRLPEVENIQISVTDNGQGIPEPLLEKIFDPFFQIDQPETTKLSKGTGVGLALVKDLVTLHGGTIDVTSVPGKQTSFKVTIKSLAENVFTAGLTDPIASQYEEELLEYQNSFITSDLSEQPLLLVVEDNVDVRNYLSDIFDSTFRVITAENGKEGLQIAIESIPDLVISDVMMPEYDGLQLCKSLKSNEATSHIPVVLLTARQSEQYQIEGFETGADAYIGKPFSSNVLMARVKNLLESRRNLRALFDKSSGFDTKVLGINAMDKAFLEKLTTIIEENLTSESVDVEWLASKIYMSRTQLYRKVKATSGQTVLEFITTLRLRKAAQLLAEEDIPMNEVAYLVGYSDASSFGRIFLKQYGTTPRKYRLSKR